MYKINNSKSLKYINKDSRIFGIISVKAFILFFLISLFMPFYLFIIDVISLKIQALITFSLSTFSYLILFKIRGSELFGVLRKFYGARAKTIKIKRER